MKAFYEFRDHQQIVQFKSIVEFGFEPVQRYCFQVVNLQRNMAVVVAKENPKKWRADMKMDLMLKDKKEVEEIVIPLAPDGVTTAPPATKPPTKPPAKSCSIVFTI